MNKVLITGIAGFIGSHLAEELLKKNYKVYGIDDLSTGTLDNLKHLKHKYLDVNINSILNFNALNSLVQECDVVFHLAAAVGVNYIMDNPLKTLQTNIKGTENVLESASYRKKKVILASTSEVYGKSEKVEFTEDSDSVLGNTTKTRWSYACTKMLDEFMAFAYNKEKFLPISIVRFFNVVGERQTGRYGMVVPRFIRAALANSDIIIYGDGNQRRCFGYVKDVVKGLTGFCDSFVNYRDTTGVYNFGSQEEVSINELAEKIIAKIGSSSEIKHVDYNDIFGAGFEDMQYRKPSLEKTKTDLRWSPSTNLDTILDKVIEYERGKK